MRGGGRTASLLVVALLVFPGCSQRSEEGSTQTSAAPGEATTGGDKVPAAPDAGAAVEKQAQPEAPATAEAPPPVDLLHALPVEVSVSSAFHDDLAQVGRLCDGNLGTAWNSRSEDLQGAWISVRLPAEAQVTGIELTAGFTKQGGDSDLFTGNFRVRRVRVSRDGAALGEFDLSIESRELQPLAVTGGGGEYRIELIDLVAGSHTSWREACISELRVLGSAASARPGELAPTYRIGPAAGAPDAGVAEAGAVAAADAGAGDSGAGEGGAGGFPVELHEADGIRLTELELAPAVEGNQTVDPRQSFSKTADERIYCFLRLDNTARAETKVHIAWERLDREAAPIDREFTIPASPHYYTYTYAGTKRPAGRYQCAVRSSSGALLGRIEYELTE